MRSSASQALLPATQRRCTETVAAMARRKRRMAPQRNHTDSVITFYNRDTEKARDKMGNKTKKFRQISTEAHRTGHRRKSKEHALPRVGAKRRSASFQSQRRSNCPTARGREKAGQISEKPPCCARTAQNGAARLRCLMRSGALPREGTFAVSLCAGCPPVQKGKKQVQVPIFAGFAQKDVMTRLPYRRDP